MAPVQDQEVQGGQYVREGSTFHIYDSWFHVTRDCTEPGLDTLSDVSMKMLKRFLAPMLRTGWTIGRDPRMQTHYKCISKWYRRGRRGQLEMIAHAGGRCLEVEFFQNVANVDNPNGGEYCFEKLKKMPYLLRLRAQFELSRLREQALAIGLVDRTDHDPSGAFGRMVHRRKSWVRSHPNMYQGNYEAQSSNNIDGDGQILTDGAWRCMYDHRGRLAQGQVYYNANNMWWLIPNDSDLHNVSGGCLFAFGPAKHPRRRPRDPVASMRRALARCIDREDWKRAEQLTRGLRIAGCKVSIEAAVKTEAVKTSLTSQD